jgi:PAS domain S-box-containing protein
MRTHLQAIGPVKPSSSVATQLVDFVDLGVELRCVLDADGRFAWTNAAWRRATGHVADALARLGPCELAHPDDRAALAAALAAGAPPRDALRIRASDGSYLRIEWLNFRREQGGFTLAVALDVTEATRRDAAMRELERATLGGCWEIDLAANRLHWSDGVYALHEIDRAQEKPRLEDGLSFYPEAARRLLEPAVERLMTHGEAYDLELPFITAQGRRLWVRATARSEMRGAKPVRVFGTIRDVTEERASRLRLEELGAVARLTESLVILCGPDSRITWVNAAFERVSGYPLAEILGQRPGDFLQCEETDPEARLIIREAMAAQKPVRVEIQNVSRSGRRYWVDLDVQPTFAADGTLSGFVGVSTDITDRRAREARLASLGREAELARMQLVAAVDAMPDAFAYYDADDRLVLCNQRYREIHGHSDETELLGERHEDVLRHGLKRGQFPEASGREEEWLAEQLASHRSPAHEHELRLTDGRWLRIIERETPDGGRIGLRVDVTSARRAEQRLSDIIRGSEAGTWEWNVQTGETVFNERWAEIIGHSLADITPTSIDTWMRFAHPDDLAASGEALERHFRGEADFYECEARMRHRDGRWIWVLDRGRVATRTADGEPEWMYGIHLDITERKMAETALVASEERFRTLFDALPDAVVLVDAETTRLRAFNQAAPDMLGYAPEQFAALTVARFEGQDGAEEIAARIARVVESGREDFETPMRRSDGTLFPVAVSALSLRRSERPELLAVFRDISDHRRQTEDLEQARQSAEAANAAKSQFLATMSHEIRTPMNGVMGMADALARRLKDPEKRAMAETIRRSGDALLTILNDILDFSKIEAGKLALEQAPFLPLEIVERIEAAYGLLAEQKGVALVIRTDLGASRPRIGDSVRVTQILHNLVGNALKFTAKGSVKLTVEGDPRGPLKLRVRDTGIGMSEDQVATLFEAFRQADASTTRRFGGTGLGMSIVKSLAELMGGSISLESWPGEGTCVEVSLPLPAARHSAAPKLAVAPAAPDALEGLRVLAADDNEINRMVLTEMLDALGARATVVSGGRQAALAAASNPFDLLLLDISMPELDGEQALAMIRAQEKATRHPSVPAIAVTANAFPHQIAAYHAAGFCGHAAKPLSLQSLREEILRVLAVDRRGVTTPIGIVRHGCD